MNPQVTRSLGEAEAGLLTAWLREELEVQVGLESTLAAIGERIVAQDAAALQAELLNHGETLDRMEGISSRREKLLGHLLRTAGIAVGEGCVRALIDAMPEESRERLLEIHESVREAAGRVRRINNRNRMLISQTVKMNELLVRGMFSAGASTSTYTADGRTKTGAEMILDRSI